MTYSLILAPSRKSIFDGAGSMFSPGLIKDMASVHDSRCTCVTAWFVSDLRITSRSRPRGRGGLIVLENIALD